MLEQKMKRLAVFVDAGYFWVQLCFLLVGKSGSRDLVKVDHEKLREHMLAEVEKQFGNDTDLLRVYWYDAPGLNGKTAGHHAIDKLDDFKLRLGTRNGEGAQKGVDGLIIADLISLTQQRAITHALVMTGDADVAPGVIAAQAMGLRVHLLSLGPANATSPLLAAEADTKRTWVRADAEAFASENQPAEPVAVAAPVVPVLTAAVTKPDWSALSVEAYAYLQNSSLAAELADLTNVKAGSIPKKIDGTLLHFCREKLGRQLEGNETTKLRAAFIKLLGTPE